jgi:hypothetical protein
MPVKLDTDKIKPIADPFEDSEKTQKGRPRFEKMHKENIASKYDKLVDDMFLLYFSGRTPTEICDIFNLSYTAFYRVKDKYKFEEEKKRLDSLAKEQAEKDMVKTRAEQIRMSSAIISITGGAILKKFKEGTLDIKIGDFLSAIRAHNLLIGAPVSDTFNHTQINISNTLPANTREMLDGLVEQLSPEERNVILEMNKKLDEIDKSNDSSALKLLE